MMNKEQDITSIKLTKYKSTWLEDCKNMNEI